MSENTPSLASSTVSTGFPSYRPPKVAALFLVHFDTRAGYTLEWSKTTGDVSLDGLDYKLMPSGIHEFDTSTVLLSHLYDKTLYYGLSRFRQINLNTGDENSRDNIKMYSLGILVEPLDALSSKKTALWKPNDFINNGWEYINQLDDTLGQYLAERDYETGETSRLETLFGLLASPLLSVKGPSHAANLDNHLLNTLPDLLDQLGPLVFPVYKLSLLRKNVLLFNGHDRPVDFFTAGAFSYLLLLLSVVPKDLDTVTKEEKNNYFSQPIYSVGLGDLDRDPSVFGLRGFIGSTTDEILKHQLQIYDYGVLLPSNGQSSRIFASGDSSPTVKATLKDYHKFKIIYKEVFSGLLAAQAAASVSTDDLASIRSSSSRLSVRHGYPFVRDVLLLDSEPSWWLEDATSAISWREYVWLAFSWFASAGTVGQTSIETSQAPAHHQHGQKERLARLVNVVGYFHKLSRKWFYVINNIILEELGERRGSVADQTASTTPDHDETHDALLLSLTSDSKITVELTYQDITDMELDPYSDQDLDFVRQFVMLYWGTIVDGVEIGIGIQGVCC